MRDRLRRLLAQHAHALALNLRLDDPALPLAWTLALLGLHLLGMLALARLTRQPLWLALIPALAIQPLVAAARRRPWKVFAPSLAPLGLAYLVALIRLVGRRLVPGWAPAGGWLNPDYVLTLAGLWTLTSQASLSAQRRGKQLAPGSVLGGALFALALAWSAATGLVMHTHGATGADPYAYVQMAVDLARHGTPQHAFPLAPLLADLGVALHPLTPLGYGIPNAATGVAATVWPPGHSAVLAVSYLLGGERGLYLTGPALGLLSLAALWLLALEVLRGWAPGSRRLAAGIAVALLATSFEQVDRQMTPMADVSAQLFSTLAIYWALRASRSPRRGGLWCAALAGLCLGAAFDVRYTQVLLAPAVAWLLAANWRTRGWGAVMATLAVCAGAASLSVAPVLWYHQVAFGGPFRVGSEELKLFSLASVWVTLPRMAAGLGQVREFRYALPFVVWGGVRLVQRERRAAIGALLWFAVLLAFHLLYEALRLRDLLPEFPVVALWAGVGAAEVYALAGRVRYAAWRTMARAATVLLIALLLCTDATLLLPVPPLHYNSFGYLVATQRGSLATLAQLTPPDAVVAASLNAGAVMLYAERDIVRPGVWTEAEWQAVVQRLLHLGRPIYVLADGEEMVTPLRVLQAHYRLEPLAALSLPYFYPGGGSENRDVGLYRVER